MPFVSGFLHVKGGGHPGNELPEGERPVDPGYGMDLGSGIDNTLPEPPPGIWPPPSFSRPIVPIIDNTLPVQPGTIWPSPGRPPHISGGPVPPTVGGGPMPGTPSRPDNTLPKPPGTPDNSLPSGKFWVVAGIPGMGWRYVCVDPSLSAGTPLPPAPAPKG